MQRREAISEMVAGAEESDDCKAHSREAKDS